MCEKIESIKPIIRRLSVNSRKFDILFQNFLENKQTVQVSFWSFLLLRGLPNDRKTLHCLFLWKIFKRIQPLKSVLLGKVFQIRNKSNYLPAHSLSSELMSETQQERKLESLKTRNINKWLSNSSTDHSFDSL